ncbi:MAG: O-antigen ligase family protein [Desulfobacteraceae bacterium]|nr:O-antigen ligase family protein [Desulfobacteraceae bacterium]
MDIREEKRGTPFNDLIHYIGRKIEPLLTKDYIFIVLFCFSVYDVMPWEIGGGRVAGSQIVFGNRLIGAGIWLVALGLLLYILWNRRDGVKEIIERYRLDFALGAFIFAGVLIGCMLNFDWQGANWPHSVVLMTSALACYSFLVITTFLFLLRGNNRGYVVFLLLVLAINLIPWWQRFDYDSIRPFIRYTLGWHLSQVSSVLRIASIYGPFAAICAVFFLGRAFSGGNRAGPIRILEGVVALSAIFGVFLSSSGTGIIGLLVGMIVFFWRILKRKKVFIITSVIAVVMVHIFVIQDNEKASTIGTILPYIQKLHDCQHVGIDDFVPILSSKTLSERPRIWIKAFSLWQQSPWFGIGPGQYNLGSEFGWVTNVHNVYLNILTECGLLVFIPFCFLLGRFIYTMRSNDIVMPVLISILVISFFENLFDKSFAWILMCSWIIATGIQEPP